jgi:hypothetical protein
MAQDLVHQKIPFEEANGFFCNEFYNEIGALAYSVKYEAWCVVNVAYKTLGSGLGVEPFRFQEITLESNDQTLPMSNADFALSAMKAYTVIDENKPGAWASTKIKPLPFKVDNQKKLEFWQWWLTEAIPQAWEMANQ